MALQSSWAAEPTKAKPDDLRERYVEGIRTIAETKASLTRANQVLSVVEAGADRQAERISEMEYVLSDIQRVTETLGTDAMRRMTEGQNLLAEKVRLEERFSVVEKALADDRALLAGATSTVDELTAAAEKSGNVAARHIAEEALSALKESAEDLHQAMDHLSETQLRVKLEFTLLNGLQARAANNSLDIKAVSAERLKLSGQVTAQRAAIDKLTTTLVRNREALATRSNEFSRNIEQFRVAQVGVLRRWLIDGPPAGETPSLTIMDIAEAGYARKPARPAPSSTVVGDMNGVPIAAGGLSAFQVKKASVDGESDQQNQLSPEVVQLAKRAKWYFAMLTRLNDFVNESLNEAMTWSETAEGWRNELSAANRTLANERGRLATLQMEQDIVSTTVALISTQGATAEAQVQETSANVARQAKRLESVSNELKRQAGL